MINRDQCLKESLKAFCDLVCSGSVTQDFIDMKKDCRLYNFFGHRKTSDYRWSNSGSEMRSENTMFKRPTKWLYDHVLKWFKIDPCKGLNGDQYRAYFLPMYLRQDWKSALKIMVGFICRLGLTPSLCEWAPLKPQAYVLLFKTRFPFNIQYLWRPIYKLCKCSFEKNVQQEMKVPIGISTTNKVSMIPTMKLLGMFTPNKQYIIRVYETFFSDKKDQPLVNRMIASIK